MNLAEAIIKKNIEKHPLKSAVGFKKKEGWKELSWKKFGEIVFKTANALKDSGVEENDKVAIYAENSAEWMIFDLAAMSIGAITVPIYSTNNAEQAEFILKDSGAKIVLVGDQTQYDGCLEILKKEDTDNLLKTIIVSKKAVWIKKEFSSFYLEDFIAKSSPELEVIPKNEDDLATIIYTSGTTGMPKGVMLTHGNFIKAFDAHFEFFKFKNFEEELSLAFLPLTHVFERSWSLLCLYGGARVYFLEDPKNIAKALEEVKPTMMCAVPRFFQKVYAGVLEKAEEGSSLKKKIFNWALEIGKQTGELRRTEKQIPFGLKIKETFAELLVYSKIKEKMGGRLWFMPCGGASLSPEVTQFFESLNIHLTVGYGLTETTATLTAFPFTNFEHGSCGKPLPGVEIRIGEQDEIQAKGNGIMKGYYNKPEETEKVFTQDGWFKTGDVGRWGGETSAGKVPDHYLCIVGRNKDLIISGGYNVYPKEIESFIDDMDGVEESAVIGIPHKDFGEAVMAIVVPKPGAKLNSQSMIDALKSKIANFKVPKRIEIVEGLPRNAMGKVQKNVLRQQYSH